jgi:hypothetical protein
MRQLFGDSETPMVLRQRCMQTLLASPSVSDCTAAKDVIKTAPYSLAVATRRRARRRQVRGRPAAGVGEERRGARPPAAGEGGRRSAEGDEGARPDAKLKELTKNLPPAEKRLTT